MVEADLSNGTRWQRPHNQSQLVQCGSGVKYCIAGERHAIARHPKYPSGIFPSDAGFDEMKHLTFWQCYEESPYLAYIFNDVHLPECERRLRQSVFDDYFVTFQCLPMVDYVHDADLAEDACGPGVDLEESLQPKRTLFDYVFAYAALTFLLIHLSIIVCLRPAGRRVSWFRDGFFVVFITLSTVDAVVVVHDNLFAYFPPLYRLMVTSTRFGEEATDLSLLASDISVYTSGFCRLYQALAHALLAANRFHAFRSSHSYGEKWRETLLKVIIGVNLGIPLLLISFVMALCYGHLLTYDAAYMLLGVYRASLLTIGALVGLGLSLITLINIRRRSSRADHLETTLTVHCAIMLMIQLLSGVWSGMELVVISDQPPLIWASLGAYAYISINYQPVWYKLISMLVITLYGLGGSVLLLILSNRVRQRYLTFYRMRRPRPVDSMSSAPSG